MIESTPERKLPAGWSRSHDARRWHYYQADETMSLCRKWGFNFDYDREDTNHESHENCADCKRRRARLAS